MNGLILDGSTQGPNARIVSGDGWTLSIDGHFPVQGEGTVDGMPAFFRARGNSASLDIGDDVVSAVITNDPYYAGAISDDEAVAVINALVAYYRQTDEAVGA